MRCAEGGELVFEEGDGMGQLGDLVIGVITVNVMVIVILAVIATMTTTLTIIPITITFRPNHLLNPNL